MSKVSAEPALDLPALVAFVAAHEQPREDDLHHWITRHMWLSGVYYGVMATVRVLCF